MLITNIDNIIKQHDCFILDIFGLIHDGNNVFDGAIEMLLKIKQQNKKAIFLSNAPRDSAITAHRLEKFGILGDLYEAVLTPGQVFLDDCLTGSCAYRGKYFAFGSDADMSLIHNIHGYERVMDITQAQFIICYGFFDRSDDNAVISALLKEAYKKKLPMICINPDKVVHKNHGQVVIKCAGYIASEYEKLGGRVTYYGKPYEHIYRKAFSHVGDIRKSRIVALGDALVTDIAGANNFGIHSCLVLTGLHSHIVIDNAIDNDILSREIDNFNIHPDFVLKNLL